ncbi:substrate-binding domain-containing protein [Thermobifida halotolerans]|uniref:Substrate-binding domain-containing protein n=1 Tax=Thermobifida halotolerans TaxID=483545 RepID=A0A399G766_9ACTN|nr:substrate-binding domain-containing protein [Thermobifida halotolerans]UOE20807.1 substrate-binding domain-containing protein [Thermobifida halotolerans]
MSRRRPTLAEVARQAGVSVSTVSKVVNGHLDVAAETRQQVEQLLQQHRYRPRRSPGRQPVGLIDLVFQDLDNSWAMQILGGVEQAAHEQGVGVVVSAVHDRDRSRPGRRWLDNLRARSSDGVVLVLSELSPEVRSQLDALGVPVVVVDPVGDLAHDVPAVGTTNWAGGLAATQHLVALGHTRIATISGPTRVLCSRARVDGYRSALDAAGLTVPEDYVGHGDFTIPGGHAETHRLLDLPEPPTAIFAGSDMMARGAYEALFERGLRVPHDVSVVGFDDLPEAAWAAPPLTTVRQPLSEMGQMATRTLLNMVAGGDPGSRRVELATELVERASTAPPPR